MSIRFSCSCGRKLKVSDEKIGMKVLCASCGATLKVPKKSQDEYWQDVPVKSAESEVDYVATIKDFLVQFVPGAAIVVLIVWLAYFLSSQVIIGKGNVPTLGTVSGKVTMEGKPLVGATVRFAALEDSGDKERRGASVALGITLDDGHYFLLYVKDTPGAPIGRNRVEVEAKDTRGRERVRPEYNTRSTQVVEVKAGQNEMNFDVLPIETMPTSSAGGRPR